MDGKQPPKNSPAHPSGYRVPARLPFARSCSSKGITPSTCSKNSRMLSMKNLAWATGFSARISSMRPALGICGSSSNKLMLNFSELPSGVKPPPFALMQPLCKTTTSGLRVSATFGVKKPSTAPYLSWLHVSSSGPYNQQRHSPVKKNYEASKKTKYQHQIQQLQGI